MVESASLTVTWVYQREYVPVSTVRVLILLLTHYAGESPVLLFLSTQDFSFI